MQQHRAVATRIKQNRFLRGANQTGKTPSRLQARPHRLVIIQHRYFKGARLRGCVISHANFSLINQQRDCERYHDENQQNRRADDKFVFHEFLGLRGLAPIAEVTADIRLRRRR